MLPDSGNCERTSRRTPRELQILIVRLVAEHLGGQETPVLRNAADTIYDCVYSISWTEITLFILSVRSNHIAEADCCYHRCLEATA